MKKTILIPLAVLTVVTVEANGAWTFSAGPAWRSRVKMETRGTAYANPLADSVTDTRGDVDRFNANQKDSANWNLSPTADPAAGKTAPDDSQVWQTSAEWQKITAVGGDAACRLGDTETDSPLGFNLQGGYDWKVADTLSVGVNLRFAGYWNMRSSSSGTLGSSTIRTETFASRYRFLNDLYTGDSSADLDPAFSQPETVPYTTDSIGDTGPVSVNDGRRFSTRLSSDLYQIGIGPKIVWTPFAGVCDCMDWLDAYGCVEVLCNIAHSSLEADGSSRSDTECLLGLGGNIGLVGNITDWCGIYGQVGYEWIDEASVSAGTFSADVDYSSLVLSAGLQLNF